MRAPVRSSITMKLQVALSSSGSPSTDPFQPLGGMYLFLKICSNSVCRFQVATFFTTSSTSPAVASRMVSDEADGASVQAPSLLSTAAATFHGKRGQPAKTELVSAVAQNISR